MKGQPDQEPASEPSASGPGLEKPEPDSTVFVIEDIEEALAEVLVQEAPAGSPGSQAPEALAESDIAAFPLPEKAERRPSLEDLRARELLAEAATKGSARGTGCLKGKPGNWKPGPGRPSRQPPDKTLLWTA